MIRFAVATLALTFFACASPPTDSVFIFVESTEQPLLSYEPSYPAQAGDSALSMRWSIGEGLQQGAPSDAIELQLRNNDVEAHDGRVLLRLSGLGESRTIDLGTRRVAPNESVTLRWSPGASPLKSTGTTVRVLAMVHYEQGGLSQHQPAQPLSVAFDAKQSRTFFSWSDDTAVRMASLGKSAADARGREAVGAALDSMGSRIGTVDGRSLNRERESVDVPLVPATQADEAKHQRATDLAGDTVGYSGGIDEVAPLEASYEEAGGQAAMASGGVVINVCNLSAHLNTTRGKMCADWAPLGYRDLGVSSGVVPEDHIANPSAYANAIARSSGTAIWQGRLDADGCTPAIEWCTNKEAMDVSTASLQIPGRYSGTTYLPGTRAIQINPAMSYAASVALRYCFSATDCRSIYKVQSADRQVRVANIVSRILMMPDNGFFRGLPTQAPLPISTDNGCSGTYSNPPYPSNFGYTDPVSGTLKYGEACADGTFVSLGASLSLIQNAQGQYVYVPNGRHTTEDAFTIAHELGHAVQYAVGGGPASTGYGDKPTTGRCSCDWVSESNRAHCLQSQHFHPTAEVEGFAHFYAARAMNDQGGDARFVYYKPYLVLNVPDTVVLPPIPLSINASYAGVGYVRYACPAPYASKSSEYDWMNFLWGMNGNASVAQRASVADLFAILGQFRPTDNGGLGSSAFIWENVAATASTKFGAGSPKAFRFAEQGAANGLDL